MKYTIVLLVFLVSAGARGVTLEEYGVALTSTGLVDHVSGLRWLDSSLTDGDLNDLQLRLDEGWRIASEEEMFFLISRQHSEFGGLAELTLDVADFQAMMTRLTVDIGASLFSSPWVCRAYGDPGTYCNSVNSYGGQFTLELFGGPYSDRIDVAMNVYLSEVPIYGSLDCGYIDCDFTGRSLMVRLVPIPGAAVLMLSALILVFGRWHGSGP